MHMQSFLVDSITAEGLVIGRNAEEDIPVGAVFTEVCLSRVVDAGGHLETRDEGVLAEVALRLEEVHWYRRQIEVVPRGHTAGLRLSGTGLDALGEALALRGPGEHVSLVVGGRFHK